MYPGIRILHDTPQYRTFIWTITGHRKNKLKMIVE